MASSTLGECQTPGGGDQKGGKSWRCTGFTSAGAGTTEFALETSEWSFPKQDFSSQPSSRVCFRLQLATANCLSIRFNLQKAT